jgi:hypothetical protein
MRHHSEGKEHVLRCINIYIFNVRRVIAQAVSRRLPLRRTGFDLRSSHVRFVEDKVALGHAFSEYFCFPCQSLHRLFHNHHHPSSGAGTIGQKVAHVPSGLSLPLPSQETKKITHPVAVIYDTIDCCLVSGSDIRSKCHP